MSHDAQRLRLLSSCLMMPNVCVTCWRGASILLETRKNSKSAKKPKNAAESRQSGARFVSLRLSFEQFNN